ncbi:protein of unknown function [Xenorhabdus doucetiae]|uniref:Uncharacterized protein n=1 Tax=Xenorhabdus doucetiae TaxID=351671 RepID=A0A068QTN9_9GAMM|nr:protein of unknown function [Xenorhabdus doucetiae]
MGESMVWVSNNEIWTSLQVKSKPPPGLAGAIHSVLLGAEVAKALVQRSRLTVANKVMNFFIFIPRIMPVQRDEG